VEFVNGQLEVGWQSDGSDEAGVGVWSATDGASLLTTFPPSAANPVRLNRKLKPRSIEGSRRQ
jgi:hypothetical protein